MKKRGKDRKGEKIALNREYIRKSYKIREFYIDNYQKIFNNEFEEILLK